MQVGKGTLNVRDDRQDRRTARGVLSALRRALKRRQGVKPVRIVLEAAALPFGKARSVTGSVSAQSLR